MSVKSLSRSLRTDTDTIFTMDNKDFKVVDKRRFTESGDEKSEVQEKEEKAEKPQDSPENAPLTPVDFSTLILSLSTSVLLHLGEIPNPQTNKSEKNLELARHTIDIIDMLKQKTKGNLTEGEGGFIDNVLYDLRMRYVNISK